MRYSWPCSAQPGHAEPQGMESLGPPCTSAKGALLQSMQMTSKSPPGWYKSWSQAPASSCARLSGCPQLPAAALGPSGGDSLLARRSLASSPSGPRYTHLPQRCFCVLQPLGDFCRG